MVLMSVGIWACRRATKLKEQREGAKQVEELERFVLKVARWPTTYTAQTKSLCWRYALLQVKRSIVCQYRRSGDGTDLRLSE